MRREGDGPVCVIVLDLAGVPWAGKASEVEHRLLSRPGVLAVETLSGGWRARVSYDQTRTDLADIWNWMVAETGNQPEQPPAVEL